MLLKEAKIPDANKIFVKIDGFYTFIYIKLLQGGEYKVKIIMDDYGLETYATGLDALNTFAANIHKNDIENTALLAWEYADEDINIDNIWSLDPSMEGIKERVAEMASKAKSNIVKWAQKLIDLIFSTFNKLIKGQKANSEVLKKNYKNAKTYIKSLKELKDVANVHSGTIKISDWGRSNLQIMVLILSISYSLTHTLKEMKDFIGDIYAKSTDESNKLLLFSLNLQVVLGLIKKIVIMCGLIMSVNVFEGSFYEEFKNVNYNYTELIKNASGLKYVNENIDMSKVINAIKTVMDDIKVSDNDVFTDFKRIKNIYTDADVKHVREAALKYMTQDIEQIRNPKSSELEYKVAYDYILENLELFVAVSENNKDLWNFDKYIKDTEVLRRKMNDVVKLIRDDKEDYMKFILNVILETGGLFTAIVSNVEKAASLHDDIIHNFMDDSTRLGRILTKLEKQRASDIDKQMKKNYNKPEDENPIK